MAALKNWIEVDETADAVPSPRLVAAPVKTRVGDFFSWSLDCGSQTTTQVVDCDWEITSQNYDPCRSASLARSGQPDGFDEFNVPNSVKNQLGNKWSLTKVYDTLSQLGGTGKGVQGLLQTVDISSYSRVKVDFWDKTTGTFVKSEWDRNILGFELGGKLFINQNLNVERAIETLTHEYSHTIGYSEFQARVFATSLMVDLGLTPIRANWVDANGNVNPTTITNQIPSSYNYRRTLDTLRGEKLLQTGVPRP